MIVRELKSRALEQLYLQLIMEIACDAEHIVFNDSPILISTDEFDYELKVKKKRKEIKLILIEGEKD